MQGLADAGLLAVVAIGSVLGASALVSASWPRRAPAAGLAAVGTLIGLGMPGSRVGMLRAVLGLGAASRIGAVLPAIFGADSVSATVIAGARLACLAAGVALFAVLCWVLVAASAAA